MSKMGVEKTLFPMLCEIFNCNGENAKYRLGNLELVHTNLNICEGCAKKLYDELSKFFGSKAKIDDPAFLKLTELVKEFYPEGIEEMTIIEAANEMIVQLCEHVVDNDGSDEEEPEPLIKKLKKPTLTMIAKDLDIDLERTDTKDDIIAKIEGFGIETEEIDEEDLEEGSED